jgi:hypothetical protein
MEFESHLETRYSSVVIAKNTSYSLIDDDGNGESALKPCEGNWVSVQSVK